MNYPSKVVENKKVSDVYKDYNNTLRQKQQIVFADSSFLGFLANAAPTQISSGYGAKCVNALPKGNGLEKAFGFQEVGEHGIDEIDLDKYKGLTVGQVNLDIEDGKSFYSKTSYVDRDLFKILKNKETGETLFYTINDSNQWILTNPFADQWNIKDSNYYKLESKINLDGFALPPINQIIPTITSGVSNLPVDSNFQQVVLYIEGAILPIPGKVVNGDFVPNTGTVVPLLSIVGGKHYLILESFNITSGDKVGHQTPFLKNEGASQIYNFKGDQFTYIVWNDSVYLCSGQEFFDGSYGPGCIMKYNRLTGWDAVLTGKAGLFGDSNYFNQTALDSSGNYLTDSYRSYDSDKDFNPRYIALFKNTAYIAGADAHPLQIKQSERNNIENFVDNTLGLQSAILNSSDDGRANSLIIDSGYNKITALSVYNDKLQIGTDKGWWVYSPLDTTLPSGKPFSAYSIQENNFTGAGPISQYATLNFRNQLYYVADYQATPELAYFNIQGNGNALSSVYNKVSDPIDTFMRKLDFSESCIGQFQDYTLVSCKEKVCGDCKIPKRYTILFNEFRRDNQQIPAFSVIDYISATNFLTNKNACYYTNTENGKLYKIISNYSGSEDAAKSDSIWQSYWTGFNPKTDTALSIKTLQKVKISGYFSENTIIEMEIISKYTNKNENKVKDDTKNRVKKFQYEFTKKDIINQDIYENMQSRFSAPYYDVLFNIPVVSEDAVVYETLSYSIKIKNSNYWYLESLVFEADSSRGTNPESIYNFKIVK